MDRRLNRSGSRKSNCHALLANTFAAKGLLGTLANENRLKLLCCLVDGEKSVQQLATMTELRQPAVSQQLALLRDVNVVASRRVGKTVNYMLTNSPTRVVLECLDELFELGILTHIPVTE